MKKKVNILLNFFVFPTLAIILLYLAFKGVDLKLIWKELLKANFNWVLVSLAFALGGFFFRALRWRLLLNASHYNLPILTTLYAVVTAYFANIAIPRFGELMRCASLKKTNNIPIDVSLGTVITERVIDLITLIIVILLVLIIDFSFFSNFFWENTLLPIGNKFSQSKTFLVVITAFLLLSVAFSWLFRNKIQEFSFVKKIFVFFKGLYQGLLSVFHLKQKWLFLLHTLLIWTCYVMMTYVVFFALEQTSSLTLTDSLFVLSIGGLGMSAPVQNGFGAFHWIVSRGLMLFGISQTDGLLYATLCHESQTLMILILGPITLLLVFLYNKNKVKN